MPFSYISYNKPTHYYLKYINIEMFYKKNRTRLKVKRFSK